MNGIIGGHRAPQPAHPGLIGHQRAGGGAPAANAQMNAPQVQAVPDEQPQVQRPEIRSNFEKLATEAQRIVGNASTIMKFGADTVSETVKYNVRDLQSHDLTHIAHAKISELFDRVAGRDPGTYPRFQD